MNPQAEKLATLSADEIAGLYKRLFESVEGALVLEHLRLSAFVYLPETEGAGPDRDVFVNIGKRSVILHIETQIRHRKEEGND